jgi:hypothetical protein
MKLEFVLLAGVIECRHALEAKTDGAANGFRDPQQLARRLFGFATRFTPDGHEIGHLREAFIAHEPRHQDIGIGQVHLLDTAFTDGLQAKTAALVFVQQGTEQARRIETREAAPINRAIVSHQGYGSHVADHAVV